MKIVITGGGGFIGSSIANRLNQLGHEILVLDDWSVGKQSNLDKNIKGKDVKTDLKDINILTYALALFKPELVIHCADKIGHNKQFVNVDEFYDNNLKGTMNLLNAMVYCDCNKIINLSTIKIYGEQETIPIKEDTIPRPISPYSQSKYLAEELLKSYRRMYHINYINLRIGNAYGPQMNDSIILNSIKSLFEFQTMTIYGDGRTTRDYIYIDDVVKAIEKCLDFQEANKTFNISYGDEIKTGVIHELVKKYTGIERECKLEPKTYLDIERLSVNVSLALEKLDWCAETNIDNGLRKTIAWYKETSARLD